MRHERNTHNGGMNMTIVIAWTTNTTLIPTGRMERFDGVNYRPEMKLAPEAKACIWLNNGTARDVKNALQYAKTIDGDAVAVLTFPESEENPLGKARNHVLGLA